MSLSWDSPGGPAGVTSHHGRVQDSRASKDLDAPVEERNQGARGARGRAAPDQPTARQGLGEALRKCRTTLPAGRSPTAEGAGPSTPGEGPPRTGLTLPGPLAPAQGAAREQPPWEGGEEDQVPAHGSGRRGTRARTEALGRSAGTPAPSCRLPGRRDSAPSFPLCPVPARQGLAGAGGGCGACSLGQRF